MTLIIAFLAIINIYCSHSAWIYTTEIPEKLCITGASAAVNGEYTYRGTEDQVASSNLDQHYWDMTIAEDCRADNNGFDRVYVRVQQGSYLSSSRYQIAFRNEDGCNYANCQDLMDYSHSTPDKCSSWYYAASWNLKVEAGACPNSITCGTNIYMDDTVLWGQSKPDYNGFFNKMADNIYGKQDQVNDGTDWHYWAYNIKLGVWQYSTRPNDGSLPETNYCKSSGYVVDLKWDGQSYDFPISLQDSWPQTSAKWVGCDEPQRRLLGFT